MTTLKEHIKDVAKSLAETMMKGDEREWPPSCSFLIYQPVRPEAKRSTEGISKAK